jgi:two-component system chemotaxis response regulator CheB
MQNRDIVVVGSSAGGIEALKTLVKGLPADLPAAVFVVQHVSQDSPGVLASILARHGPLPATMVEEAQRFECGRIYVAPPNRHMIVTDDRVCAVFGPRENRSRPAIDPLFRTAAVHFDGRVIGVVLTGLLGDGASGLRAIAQCGGIALVQTPEDAQFGQMPRNALERVPTATQVVIAELAPLLVRLTHEDAPPASPIPKSLRIEAKLTERAMIDDDWNQVPGKPTRYTCPECSGSLQEIDENGDRRYRCRVGHAYSEDDLLSEKGKALEDSLWMALQTLEERAEMLKTMARADRARGWESTARNLERRAEEAWHHTEVLRDALTSLNS